MKTLILCGFDGFVKRMEFNEFTVWENDKTSANRLPWTSILKFRLWGCLNMGKVDLKQFSEKQLIAIGLLSQPNKAGFSFEEIAEKAGISVRQLHRWRSNPEFKQAVVEQSLENVKEVIPNVLKAHVKRAESGNVKAIELFYKLFGLLVEKQEIEQNVKTEQKDNADLAKELEELKSLIDEAKDGE